MHSDCDHNHIAGFLDADWANCPIHMRSTTGIVSLLEVIWCREKVKTKLLSLNQVQSQNIRLWLILYVSL